MVSQKMQEIVDVLANPYLYGMSTENVVPVSVRKQGEIFSNSLLSLRAKDYPVTHKDKSGNGYISTRAFAALAGSGRPVYGAVVFAGSSYDIYIYEESKLRLELMLRGVKIEGETPTSARKGFLSALRTLPHFSGADIFSVRVFVSKSEFPPRAQQLLSDGDIEADAYV